MVSDKQWLSVRDVASLLRVKDETVRRWIRRGELVVERQAGERSSYVTNRLELDRFIRKHYRPAAGNERQLPPLAQPVPNNATDLDARLARLPGIVYLAVDDVFERAIMSTDPAFASLPQGPWQNNIHPDDVNDVLLAAELATRERSRFDMQYRLLVGTNSSFWVHDCAEPHESGLWHGHIRDANNIQYLNEQHDILQHREHLLQAFTNDVLTASDAHQVIERAATCIRTCLDTDLVEVGPLVDGSDVFAFELGTGTRPWGYLNASMPDGSLRDDGAVAFLQCVADIVTLALRVIDDRQPTSRWYSIPDLARMFQVQEETVRRWIRRGELQVMNLGSSRAGYRIHPVDLERFIASHYRRGAAV